jgi:NAD-dependent dihydropyrimidine dehydrogenase PreA subunit
MKRRIIEIDQDKCNGCGACANACHEGAIAMVDGKAKLMRDDYCDGMGDCLPNCPTGAITFVEREADAYDEQAVLANKQRKLQESAKAGDTANGTAETLNEDQSLAKLQEMMRKNGKPIPRGCPGMKTQTFDRSGQPQPERHDGWDGKPADMGHGCPGTRPQMFGHGPEEGFAPGPHGFGPGPEGFGPGPDGFDPGHPGFGHGPFHEPMSRLSQWPVQIKLVPVSAPFYQGAKLLIAADCTAYAYAAFHERFIKGHITLVGCPKLDDVDYSEKLTEIIKNNDIKSVTIVRMEVPCCGGLENAAKKALQSSGKFIPWQVVTISTDGRILD